MPEPINATLCSYCASHAVYQGRERNNTARGIVKYACEAHKRLINVVAEYSSRTKPTTQANQAGMF